MKGSLRKRSFSLLEIVVVFALLAIVMSVAGIKIFDAVEKTRFQESYKLLQGKIELSRKLAKFTQGGITLTLDKKSPKEPITFFLDGESLPNIKIKNVLKIKEALPGILNIFLDSTTKPSADFPICLTFYPSNVVATGVITLDEDASLEVTSSIGNQTPRKIALSQAKDNNLISEGKDLYPHELKKEDLENKKI